MHESPSYFPKTILPADVCSMDVTTTPAGAQGCLSVLDNEHRAVVKIADALMRFFSSRITSITIDSPGSNIVSARSQDR
jgi:uncharacterized protein (UPF0261 family)